MTDTHDYGPPYAPDIAIDHPASLLHAIWKNPEIAPTVKTLCYHNADCWVGDRLDYFHVDADTLAKLRECGADLLGKCAYLPYEDRAGTLKNMLDGDETPAFVILLCLLPNLEDLTLIRCYWEIETMLRFIRRIRSAMQDLKRPLQNLKSVSTTADFKGIVSLNHFMAFAFLPTVSSLSGLRVIPCAQTGIRHPYLGSSEPSFVEKMTLKRSLMRLDDIRKALTPMTQLKELTYHHEAEEHALGWISDAVFAAGSFTELVAEIVGKTLQKFRLRSGRDPTDAIVDFLAFEALQELEIDASFVLSPSEIKEDEVDVPGLVDILPKSLESLFLNFSNVEEANIPRFFIGWEERKLAKLPRLSRVTCGPQPLDESLKEKIKAEGVRLFSRKKWETLE